MTVGWLLRSVYDVPHQRPKIRLTPGARAGISSRVVFLGVLISMALVTKLAYAGYASARVDAVPRPRLIALSYGRFRPTGAPHGYLALRFKLEEPRGQIVETTFQEINARGRPDGIGGQGDSQCGIGGRQDGGVETSFIPVTRPLSAGKYRVRVTAYGSLCTKHGAIVQRSMIFELHVDS